MEAQLACSPSTGARYNKYDLLRMEAINASLVEGGFRALGDQTIASVNYAIVSVVGTVPCGPGHYHDAWAAWMCPLLSAACLRWYGGDHAGHIPLILEITKYTMVCAYRLRG